MLRVAAEDLYYHGVRLVVANVVWGIGVVAVAFSLTRSALGWLILVAMIPLSVGLMGMATALVRERSLVLSDFTRAIRARFWRLLALGVGQLALIAVSVFDLALGLQMGGPIGLVFALLSFYTALAIWLLAVTVWPIVTDPERRDEPVRSGVRLGGLLILAHPFRIGLLALVLAIVAAVASILAAAILTFAAAYLALVAAHFVLPAADRLEGRRTLLED